MSDEHLHLGIGQFRVDAKEVRVLPSIWCEHCCGHFSQVHYNDDGEHMIGEDYGPYGELLEQAQSAESLLVAAKWLLRLKDGPRDEQYEREKPDAWASLRLAVEMAER